MPTYDYRCKACGNTWEEFQSIKAEATKKCPACNKKQAERMIGPGAGILFKGSGFYITDYRSEGYKKAASSDKESGGGKASGGEKSSDRQERALGRFWFRRREILRREKDRRREKFRG